MSFVLVSILILLLLYVVLSVIVASRYNSSIHALVVMFMARTKPPVAPATVQEDDRPNEGTYRPRRPRSIR